jgi:hypothetical protein
VSEKFSVEWGVDDGYVGSSRPHSFHISDNDLFEDYTDQELKDLFWDEVRNEFESTIHFYSDRESEFVEWAKNVIEKQKEANSAD